MWRLLKCNEDSAVWQKGDTTVTVSRDELLMSPAGPVYMVHAMRNGVVAKVTDTPAGKAFLHAAKLLFDKQATAEAQAADELRREFANAQGLSTDIQV